MMGRKSAHNLPPGIDCNQHGQLWATLEGEDAKRWRERNPGHNLPCRKAANLKVALQLQRQFMRDIETGRDSNAENPTLAVWITTWIDGKHRLAPSTERRYRHSLRGQIEPHRISQVRLMQLTPEHIKTWIRDMKAQTRHEDDQHTLDSGSIRSAFAVVRAALNTAVQRNRIPKNPCHGIELSTLDNEHIQPLTTAQAVNAFMQEVDEDRHLAGGESTQPQKEGIPRRTALIAQPCDFSQIDFAEPEIRRSLKSAYRVLLRYRARPLSTQAQEV